MKAINCRGGKLARFFCYILMLVSLLIFSSMFFPYSSNFERMPVFAQSVEILPQKEMFEEYRFNSLHTSYNSQNQISILGRVIRIVDTNTTSVTPNYQVARFINGPYDGRFYFGHNFNYLFGGLANISNGSMFSITIDERTHYYRVAYVETVTKVSIMNGEMANIARAKWNGQNYSVSLMTCAGQSYGNGDASHRVLVFANEV